MSIMIIVLSALVWLSGVVVNTHYMKRHPHWHDMLMTNTELPTPAHLLWLCLPWVWCGIMWFIDNKMTWTEQAAKKSKDYYRAKAYNY